MKQTAGAGTREETVLISLKEKIYSVLIVSASDKMNQTLSGHLPASDYSPVTVVKSISAAQRVVAEKQYDLIIINTPLPDDFGSRLAVDLSNNTPAVVMMMTAADLYNELFSQVRGQGVLVMRKPVSMSNFLQGIDWMCTFSDRIRKMQKKNVSLNQKMSEIRIVNHAKWFLIEEHGMSESEAHRRIEKMAMDRSITKREVAEIILHQDNRESDHSH